MKLKKHNRRRPIIMPMGDSLTLGFADTNTALMAGYRGPLFKLLSQYLGFPPVFVGDNRANFGATGFCGTSGLTVSEVTASPYASKQVLQYKPDFILLHIGTNDCTQLNSGGSPTLATSRTNLTILLNTIRSASPATKVLIARIIDNNTAHTQVVNYNAAAIDIDTAARQDFKDSLIKIVDVYNYVGLYTATNWADGTHLNTTGYGLMATSWYNALIPIL